MICLILGRNWYSSCNKAQSVLWCKMKYLFSYPPKNYATCYPAYYRLLFSIYLVELMLIMYGNNPAKHYSRYTKGLNITFAAGNVVV